MTRARPLELHRRLDTGLCYPHGSDNTGLHTLREAEADAAHGSTMLASKCQRVIWDFAAEHRIPVDDAKVLLLDTGVSLPRDSVGLLLRGAWG